MAGKRKATNPLTPQKFITEVKKEKTSVVIRPYELLNTRGKQHCSLTDEKIAKVKELSILGSSNNDICGQIGLSQHLFRTYMNQGRLVEAYIHGVGIDPDFDKLWEEKIPTDFELEDETGLVCNIFKGCMKYKLYRAVLEGRAKGTQDDLQRIKNAREDDWKAAVWLIERRSPEYRKESPKETPAVQIINNRVDNSKNTLVQNIRNIAQELRDQDIKRGLLTAEENAGQVIEAEVIKED